MYELKQRERARIIEIFTVLEALKTQVAFGTTVLMDMVVGSASCCFGRDISADTSKPLPVDLGQK